MQSSGEVNVATKRVFIAFAKEDERIRDLLKGQALNTRSPFEYIDMSVKEPYDSNWKERVRTRIRGCDGVIALISKNTPSAAGERWEIQCAIDEGKPLLGLWIYKGDRTEPDVMKGQKIVVWTWEAIADFIDSL